MSTPSYALWSIWNALPLLHKLFFFVLGVVGIYSVFSATKILTQVHFLIASSQSKDVPSLQDSLATLQGHSANARQLITATFYLFGIVFFWGLHFALWTPDSKIPVGILILENFFLYFAFAANAFFVFLVLHSVQWFAAARLGACVHRLNFLHIA